MYLTDVHIQGMKLLRDFRLSFKEPDGSPRMWTVLLGENGRCKTSVLRAIAMAASGASRTHELADLASLHDRRGPQLLTINASFAMPPDPRRVYPSLPAGESPPPCLGSELTMEPGLTSMRGNSWYFDGSLRARPAGEVLFDIRGGNLPHWFVAGYGTTRFLRVGLGESTGDPSVSRLATLFDRGTIIGPGFADLLADPNGFSMMLRRALIEAHVLPDDASGIELRGRGGVRSAADLVEGSRFILSSAGREMKVPATWLSQGYQSTIAWLADLIGHVMLENGGAVPLDQIRGLVLIDEIDLHLHPAWQVRLVKTLRAALPNVQFVVTTHSPMILPSLGASEIVVLDLDVEGNVIATEPGLSPMLLTASEIYRGFFGISGPYPTEIGEDYQRYMFLVGNSARTDDEDVELTTIRGKLRALGIDPGWEPVPRQAS